jgi:hypothetical protein
MPADTRLLVAASVVLQRLHDEMPPEHFAIGWLMHRLHKRSFGIIVLLIALAAIVPGLSIAAGLLLMIPALQMAAGKPAPVFPNRIATRSLPTRLFTAAVQRFVPVLGYLERGIHPRWHTPIKATKRVVGVVVSMLSVTLVFFPVPLSNVAPALAVALISLAYLEDGILLLIAVLVAVILLVLAMGSIWEMAVGAKWMVGRWL